MKKDNDKYMYSFNTKKIISSISNINSSSQLSIDTVDVHCKVIILLVLMFFNQVIIPKFEKLMLNITLSRK